VLAKNKLDFRMLERDEKAVDFCSRNTKHMCDAMIFKNFNNGVRAVFNIIWLDCHSGSSSYGWSKLIFQRYQTKAKDVCKKP
jgi:hypothetical protein